MAEGKNIKDAEIISEEGKKLSDNNTQQKRTTKDIPVGEKQSDEKETVKVDFMKSDFTKDYIGKKTVKSDEKTEGEEKKEKQEDVKDLRERIVREEKEYAEQFTKEDFADIAEIMIDLFDTGVSTSLRFWSKDTSDQAYEINVTKKKRLVKYLTFILVKYQLKWSLEFLFIITLLVTYWTPFMKARERRKHLKDYKIEPKTSVKTEPSTEHNYRTDRQTNNKPKETANNDESTRPKKAPVSRPGTRRSKGNPGKA